MLLDFTELVKKYDMKIKGIVHIGAHYGQEHNLYKSIGVEKIVYFEPLKNNFEKLRENIKDDSLLFNLALGNENKEIEMYVENANQGMSSSVLKPLVHLTQYPHIKFETKEVVQMKKLDDVSFDKSEYNLITIDVQGFELEVFKGSIQFLEGVDYIFSEVNRDEVYENCTKIDDLTTFLNSFGFELVEINWVGGSWGEGLYIKK